MITYIGLTLVSVLFIAFAGEMADFFHGIKIPLFNKPYVRHFALIVFLSFLFILFNRIFTGFLNDIQMIHDSTLSYFTGLFNTGRIGAQLIEVFVLLLLSTLPWLIFSLLYWVSKKTYFSHFYSCVWLTWLVVILSVHIS